MTKMQAVSFLVQMIDRVGMGYHPDTPIEDYVDSNGHPTFSDEYMEKQVLQAKHDEMMEVLGDKAYSIGVAIFEALN